MSIAAPKIKQNNVFKRLMSLHWWMAICYLLLFLSGEMISKIQGKFSHHELLLAAHKSFGVLVLLLLGWRIYLLMRVWVRKYSNHLPKLTGNWYFKTCLYTVLYLMMFTVPLTGYWLSNTSHHNDISLFGLLMPDIFPVNRDVASKAKTAHNQTSEAFKIFLIIHLIAQRKSVRANWRRLSSWALTFRSKG